MKLKHTFLIREVAGEYVLIPMGNSALQVCGMITTNAVGAFICEQLQQEISEAALLDAVCREFEVPSETAQKDLSEFLQMLHKARLLET